MSRITIGELGEFAEDFLQLWTFVDRKPAASTMVKDIVTARVDANIESIEQKIEYCATLYGIPAEELKKRIKAAANDRGGFVALRRQLVTEARSNGIEVDEPEDEE